MKVDCLIRYHFGQFFQSLAWRHCCLFVKKHQKILKACDLSTCSTFRPYSLVTLSLQRHPFKAYWWQNVPMYQPTLLTLPYQLGLGPEFRSEKIPRNRLGTVSVIPRKKVLIPRHSEFGGTANSKAPNGMKWNRIPQKNLVLRYMHIAQPLWSLWRPLHSTLSSFILHAAEWFGT